MVLQKSALIFGAGNIGRGFLGLELHRLGFDLTFVESSASIIDMLNRKREYEVQVAEEGKRIFVPVNKAVSTQDTPSINYLVKNASLIATAVGPHYLKDVGRILFDPIKERANDESFLNVIACENMVGNSRQLRVNVLEHLTKKEKDRVATFVGFPGSVVDRISIPVGQSTLVEKGYEWIAEADFWKAFSPPQCIKFVAELEPYLKRKLYMLNGAHAIIGYASHPLSITYVHEAMQNPSIRNLILGYLEETSEGLAHNYGFSKDELNKYQQTLIGRFDNHSVRDLTSRLVRGQIRKLDKQERLVGPALLALEAESYPKNIAKGIVSLLNYYDEHDDESLELYNSLSSYGLNKTLKRYSDLDENKPIERKLIGIIERELSKN